MSATVIRRSSDIEKARVIILRVADYLDVDGLRLEAGTLRNAVTDYMWRGFTGRQTRTKRLSLTPPLADAIRVFAAAHPDWSQDEIGRYFNVAGGRVSEALAGTQLVTWTQAEGDTVKRLVLDLETCSPLNLRACGAHAYFEHPDTHVICAAWALDNEPVYVWVPGDPPPVFEPPFTIIAHNYLFEQTAWNFLLTPRYGWQRLTGRERWSCTMARGLALALPASLDTLGEALELHVRKDRFARDLMMRMSRPRSVDEHGRLVWWHKTDPEKLNSLIDYCMNDVEVERVVDQMIPELLDTERRIFEIDGNINRRGILIDVPLVERMTELAAARTQDLDKDMARITSGEVRSTAQVGVLANWLRSRGCPVENVAKGTVREALNGAVPGTVTYEALATRAEAARSSTKKLNAMRLGMSDDHRLRGLFQYGGAGRTMRWAGRRVQPQNFIRPILKPQDTLMAVALCKMSSTLATDLDMLFPDTALGVIASCLRSCFVAPPGYKLVIADFAQIEARVLAWLAGQNDMLDVFRRGEDAYTYAAQQQGSDSRQFGKVLVLALGYGMGAQRFLETAATYGIGLIFDAALEAVQTWRGLNRAIVGLWRAVDSAARQIAVGYMEPIAIGHLTLARSRKAMRLTLPSGRDLIYHKLTLDDQTDSLVFMGVDPMTKRWCEQRTYGAKLVENATQAMARDLMAHAMIAIDPEYPLIGTIHDELIAEVSEVMADRALTDMLNVMTIPPSWAIGLPLDAEGRVADRYTK